MIKQKINTVCFNSLQNKRLPYVDIQQIQYLSNERFHFKCNLQQWTTPKFQNTSQWIIFCGTSIVLYLIFYWKVWNKHRLVTNLYFDLIKTCWMSKINFDFLWGGKVYDTITYTFFSLGHSIRISFQGCRFCWWPSGQLNNKSVRSWGYGFCPFLQGSGLGGAISLTCFSLPCSEEHSFKSL